VTSARTSPGAQSRRAWGSEECPMSSAGRRCWRGQLFGRPPHGRDIEILDRGVRAGYDAELEGEHGEPCAANASGSLLTVTPPAGTRRRRRTPAGDRGGN